MDKFLQYRHVKALGRPSDEPLQVCLTNRADRVHVGGTTVILGEIWAKHAVSQWRDEFFKVATYILEGTHRRCWIQERADFPHLAVVVRWEASGHSNRQQPYGYGPGCFVKPLLKLVSI